jgi:RNA polymerase sigma factor (sigma-70 family)
MATPELQEFFEVLQSGDPSAVEELLREFDPFLRQAIRLRMIDGRLRRAVDTTDIFHSLLKDFLRPKKSSDPPANASAELHAYLAAAVRHKIQTKLRKERRHAGSLPADRQPVSREPAVGEQVEYQDFTHVIKARLDESCRTLFELKSQGLTWAEIAAKLGGRPDALRMRLNRAIAALLSQANDSGYEEQSHARRR